MKELHEMGYDELNDHVKDAIKEMRRKAYAEGYGQGKFDAQKDDDIQDAKLREISETILTPEKLAKLDQKRRDEIVTKAKADIDNLKNIMGSYTVKKEHYLPEIGSSGGDNALCNAEFIVNADKRTIVVLMKGHIFTSIYAKGIAKCDPSDCFNAHIGKAIALRRALGLVIPSDYLNVPNPTEVRVGDIIMRKGIVPGLRVITGDRGTRPNGERYFKTKEGAGTTIESNINKIIDDSRE